MPIYRLTQQLAGGASSRQLASDDAEKLTAGKRDDHRHRFWELPESDQQRHPDAGKPRRIDSLTTRVSSSLRLMMFIHHEW